MQVTQEEYKSLLDELVNKVKESEIRPDEITTKMFCEKTGYSVAGASAFLDREVKEGRLIKRQALIDGKWNNVYGKPAECDGNKGA